MAAITSNESFHAHRVARTGVIEVDAPLTTVFPLLCPVRERDWIPGWQADVVYSASGLVEDGCVFTSPNPQLGTGLYVCSRHEPAAGIVEFVIVYPAMCVAKLDIAAASTETGGTRLRWSRTYTGLSAEGNAAVDAMTEELFQQQVAALGKAMARYCQAAARP